MFHHSPYEAVLQRRFFGHTDGLWEISTSTQNSSFVGTASADGTARIWDISNGLCLAIYHEHKGSANSIRFHPTQPLACSASGDGGVYVWPLSFDAPPALRWSDAEDTGAAVATTPETIGPECENTLFTYSLLEYFTIPIATLRVSFPLILLLCPSCFALCSFHAICSLFCHYACV